MEKRGHSPWGGVAATLGIGRCPPREKNGTELRWWLWKNS